MLYCSLSFCKGIHMFDLPVCSICFYRRWIWVCWKMTPQTLCVWWMATTKYLWTPMPIWYRKMLADRAMTPKVCTLSQFPIPDRKSLVTVALSSVCLLLIFIHIRTYSFSSLEKRFLVATPRSLIELLPLCKDSQWPCFIFLYFSFLFSVCLFFGWLHQS